MIPLLFVVLFAEGVVAFLLLVKIGPVRELVMKGLDQAKTGKGPATVKTIGGTMSVILLSNLYSIAKIQNKGAKVGTMTPMDQVLWRTHLLEASLMGFCLFLGFLIDRIHHYLQKLVDLKETIGSSKRELEKLEKEKQGLKKKEEKDTKELKLLQEQMSNLKEEVEKIKLESKEKDKQVQRAESRVAALQEQSADLLLEYDHLLKDNQILQSQTSGQRN